MFEILKGNLKEKRIKLTVETAIKHWNSGEFLGNDYINNQIEKKLIEKFTDRIIQNLTYGDNYEKLKDTIIQELLSRQNVKKTIDDQFSILIRNKLFKDDSQHY